MKNLILLLMLLVCFACNESELTNFAEPDAIYFQLEKTDFTTHYTYWDDWLNYKGDSVPLSFGAVPKDHEAYKEKDTLWLQLNLLGNMASFNRTFKISINHSLSTAKEGVHYKALNTEYPFPKDTIRTSFPIVFYNDESLGEEPYILYLELEENEDFILGLEKRTHVRIQVYNDVVRPKIWDQYLYSHLGPYSKAKHRVILLTNGAKILPNTLEEYKEMGGYYSIYHMRAPMNAYLEANEVYDENGERINPW